MAEIKQTYFKFSFMHSIKGDCFGLCLDKNSKHYNKRAEINTALLELISYLSSSTWQEIENRPRNMNFGSEHLKITSLNQNIQNHFKKITKQEKCNVFRFGKGNYRACGFRVDDVFYLVCCDYDFSLYKH
ncbi:hypothetical protein [Campylobacter sp.]|uniref:hypothetical protein n=1 Tax=Campylobacter sp. TaxID=205 RepID=UPI002A7543FF|nr:hypothetical protein [Campylobacter sp.]MDY3245819.1 hypothetical protein [Campylobacter sp.]